MDDVDLPHAGSNQLHLHDSLGAQFPRPGEDPLARRKPQVSRLYLGSGLRALQQRALLAGQLRIAEAVPDLTSLQDSTYIGSYTLSSLTEKFDGEVDHRTYLTFTMRQVAHLSLRRLGKTPAAEPVLLFEKRFEDHERDALYIPKFHETPRHTRSDSVRKGMKPEEVLDVVGFPDFVGLRDTWEYDMDTTPPHTLIVTWDERRVTAVEKRVPALWEKGTARDERLGY